MLRGSDRLGREKMTGRDDVTDWCVSNLALSWLGHSLKEQGKYTDAIKVYEEQLEIEQSFGPDGEDDAARG